MGKREFNPDKEINLRSISKNNRNDSPLFIPNEGFDLEDPDVRYELSELGNEVLKALNGINIKTELTGESSDYQRD